MICEKEVSLERNDSWKVLTSYFQKINIQEAYQALWSKKYANVLEVFKTHVLDTV